MAAAIGVVVGAEVCGVPKVTPSLVPARSTVRVGVVEASVVRGEAFVFIAVVACGRGAALVFGAGAMCIAADEVADDGAGDDVAHPAAIVLTPMKAPTKARLIAADRVGFFKVGLLRNRDGIGKPRMLAEAVPYRTNERNRMSVTERAGSMRNACRASRLSARLQATLSGSPKAV